MKRIMMSIALMAFIFIQYAKAQDKTVAILFNKSLDSYYNLKNALAKDNPQEAQKLASLLQADLKAVPHKGFANNVQHELWMQQSSQMLQKLTELSSQSDLDSQRKSFKEISNAMVTLTTDLKVNHKKAYVQYCPMGKYTWLNEVKEVQNPFYGSKMYDCGEVKATISNR
jgi:hypothetical protein